MASARALLRPLWTCKACRVGQFRAFTTSSSSELPRRRYRPVSDLAPYRADTLEVTPGFDAKTEEAPALQDELSAFEEDAITKPKNAESLASKHSRRDTRKDTRSDGISNISNRRAKQALSIPDEFVQEDELVEPSPRTEQETTTTISSRRQTSPPQPNEQQEQPMSDLPWYLQPQHQQPIRALPDDGPIFERQKVPDLPIHPPQHLESILNHLSLEIGLDYLSILDLRRLDPPPALGNNLIMIIGTARHEKHLNVAAERFCAWLRREYQLWPYPDGLLGRNELKLRQRRKAKKSRALANAGASTTQLEELDDGIKTGWICVHAGYLNPHPDAPRKARAKPNHLIGFGEENDKVTLVVQMFTEEKRGLVDIESLWSGILERNLKRQDKVKQAANDVDGEVAKADEDDQGLTNQEIKARRRFKMGDKTVLDDVDASLIQDDAPQPTPTQPTP